MSEDLESGILVRSTILIIDSDKSTRDQIERYLLLSATHKVHTATSPLLALRIIQDTKAAVSCIICAHKPGSSTSIEFLENLRAGRWSSRLRKVPIVLQMPRQDFAVIQAADCLAANAYLIGELDRDVVIDTLTNVLLKGECDGPLARFPLAHVRIAGADTLLIPLAQDLTTLPPDRQQAVVDAFQAAATAAGLAGAIVPLWMRIDDSIAFLAPPNLHAALGALRADFVTANLSRRLSISPDHGVASGASPGLPFYALPAAAATGSGEKNAGTAPDEKTRDQMGGGRPSKASGPVEARGGADGITREMNPDDVTKVIAVFKQLGAEKFLQAFLRSQDVSRLTGGKIVPVMKEYYFSLDALRQALFREADLRAGNMFGELTLALDQALLRSYAHLPDTATTPFSLNLNVQSCFTKPFEAFLEEMPGDRFTIEFRQPNIVEFYDEYVLARAMLNKKGIRIAVDGIFPDAIGLVSLEYLGASMAKVHWGEGAADGFRARAKALARIMEMDVEVVICRVDEKAAVSLGNALGIERFQGRLMDELVRRAA